MTAEVRTNAIERRVCASCYKQLEAADRYCANCGQAARLQVPTLFEFVHEFFSHYVALDRGVLWRSLAALAFRPGRLALEYFAGRRRQYVPPLRLYLTASILFFVAIKLTGPDFEQAVKIDQTTGERVVATGVPENQVNVIRASPGVAISMSDMQFDSWGALEPARLKLVERFRRIQSEFAREGASGALSQVMRNFVQSLYYAMFVLLPLYAALLKLVFFDRGRTYGEHMVVGLYSHAMVFFLLLALYLAGWPLLQFAIVCLLFVYPGAELRRVYGGSRWGTFWRASAVALLYLLVCGPVIALFFVYSFIA